MNKERAAKGDGDYAVLCEYWQVYGGWGALLKSPYFYGAALLAASAFDVWSESGWWEMPQAILPNLLGFSLAGYAIFLSFGSEEFRRFLSSVDVGGTSAFVSMTTTFMHFVVLQVLAILLSMVARFLSAIEVPLGFPMVDYLPCIQVLFWMFCFLVFCYAMTSLLASVVAIYRIVRMFDAFSRR